MVRIRCETARFMQSGDLRCVRCGVHTPLAPDSWIVMLVFPMRIIAWDAQTGSLLHECRRTSPHDLVTLPTV